MTSIEIKSEKVTTLQQVFSNADAYDIFLMILGTFGGIITGLAIPVNNALSGRILDDLNSPGDFQAKINQICIDFTIIGGACLFTGFAQVYCWTIAGERQTKKFRMRYVKAILSQEIGWFDSRGSSELSTDVADLTEKIQDGLGRKMGDMFQYIAQVVGSLGVAFYLSWKVTLVLLCAIPVIAAAGTFMILAITDAQHKSHEQYAHAGGIATEAISSIRTVTAFNMQPIMINDYRKYLFEAMQIGILKGIKMGLGNGAIFCAVYLTYALGFWYGAELVANDREHCTHNCLTGGDVMAAFISVVFGAMAMGQAAPPITSFATARAAIAKIFTILERKPLIDGLSDQGAKPDVRISGEIIFRDVQFAYPTRPDIMVCKGYQLNINAGDTVALVGASGCGKSTIINLLLRFYDPLSGVITLDGLDIKTLNIKWLRSQIGYVGQEPVLFAGTIAENIASGLNAEAKELLKSSKESQRGKVDHRHEELMEQIIFVARLANAHDFISQLPQGYDTDVGSNGVAMSGGQKQRIAIARALIKKPAVLLLDEATSALDAASEKVVQQSIDELARSKAQTTIIVAHRLSTIRNADKICVIQDGKIVETGTHEELIERHGAYAELVSLQLQAEEEPNARPDEAGEQLKEVIGDVTVTGGTEGSVLVSEEKKKTVSEQVGKAVTSEPLSKEVSKSVSRKIWSLMLEHPGLFLIGLLGGACFGAVFPVWGLLVANSQNMFYLSDTDEIRQRAKVMSLSFVGIAGYSLLSCTALYYGTTAMGEKISSKLRSELFEVFLRYNIGYYDREENSVGVLTNRLAEDSSVINKAFGGSIARELQAFFTLVIGLALGLSSSWKIALVVLATFPLTIVASGIQMQALKGQQYDQDGESDEAPKAPIKPGEKEQMKSKPRQHGSSTGGILSTAFIHMRTVSAFSLHETIVQKYEENLTKVMNDRIHRSVVASIGFAASNSIIFYTYALIFWYGAKLIIAGEISFVQLMSAMFTLMLSALGLGTALADLGDQQAGIEIAHRIFKDIEDGHRSPIDGLSTTGHIPETRVEGRIELKNVSFVYPTRPEVTVCNNYNLSIAPGETVAFVGASGCGKSTVINLLLRFYDPLEGEILLDGMNIKELSVRWLRSQIGYVGQEPVLFKGSVLKNVLNGRSMNINQPLLSLSEAMAEAEKEYLETHPNELCESCCWSREGKKVLVPQSEENVGDIEMRGGEGVGHPNNHVVDVADDVIDACKAANAYDFITQFPEGFHTEVGESSTMISGGQKQRIAIARALIKKPAVLLLDEATSALDAASEKVVQQSIDELARSKAQTTIIIAHRLSTIRNADRIVVIDKGTIQEIGSHEELLSRAGGLYKQLWDKQNKHGHHSFHSHSSMN